MRKTTLLVIAALYGCASAPEYQRSAVPAPYAFRESTARENTVASTVSQPARVDTGSAPAAVATGYWEALSDTTLNRLITEALQSNLDVRAAEARVRGARANRTTALLDLTPSATFQAGYNRQRLSGASFPNAPGAFPDQGIYDAGFDASWELDLFGRIRRNAEARGALVGVAQEDQRDVRISLSAELARAYFELRGSQERLAVAQRNSENQRRTLDLTKERLDAGRGTAFDTERAQAQLSSTLALIPTLEDQVASAQYRIGVLVGRSPAKMAEELSAMEALPQLPPVPVVSDPESIIRNRPDVAAAERQSAAEEALVRAAKAEYLPRLSIGGAAGYTSSEFSSLGGDGTFRYAVGPVVTWPLFNLGRIKANVDATRAREDEARAQYNQTVLAAMEDVESSLSQYRTSLVRVERLEEASAASERAAELARLRFTEGVSDFLQVLDAERTQLESQDRLAQSRIDAATAYAALYKALGGR
jgi:outer membrane protein, multidrug efflux system